MKSLKIKVEPGSQFFSKSMVEHQKTVGEVLGVSPDLVEVRYLTLDTGAHEAIIFYVIEDGETRDDHG